MPVDIEITLPDVKGGSIKIKPSPPPCPPPPPPPKPKGEKSGFNSGSRDDDIELAETGGYNPSEDIYMTEVDDFDMDIDMDIV